MTDNSIVLESYRWLNQMGINYPYESICNPSNECYQDCEQVRLRVLHQLELEHAHE